MFETDMFLDAMEKLVAKCHQNSKDKGFWTGEHNDNIPTKLCLIHSEVSEWLEAHRTDPKAPCGKMLPYEPTKLDESGNVVMIPLGGVTNPMTKEAEEAADIFIRLADLCGRQDIDLGRAVLDKMWYNATRSHMHGGKKC